MKIVCALINAFKKTSNIDTENDRKWAAQILRVRDRENQLQQRLERINRNKNKPHWKKYDAKTVIFPTLTEEDVEDICFGK